MAARYVLGVTEADTQVPAPPQGMHPAQMGLVLLGRPILGHVAATLVDLVERGRLEVTRSTKPGGSGYKVVRVSAPDVQLLHYEDKLAHALCGESVNLSSEDLDSRLAPALHEFRRDIIADAVAHGWLHRLHHDRRTDEADAVVSEIRHFRFSLVHLYEARESSVPPGLLGYVTLFGMRHEERPSYQLASAVVEAASSLNDWKKIEHAAHYEPDLLSHNQWGGMGPGYVEAWSMGL